MRRDSALASAILAVAACFSVHGVDVGTAHAAPREPKEIGPEHVDSFETEGPWDLGLGRGGRYVLLGTGALVIAAVCVALRRRASRPSRPPRTPRYVHPR
jgi:hypothetical protein